MSKSIVVLGVSTPWGQKALEALKTNGDYAVVALGDLKATQDLLDESESLDVKNVWVKDEQYALPAGSDDKLFAGDKGFADLLFTTKADAVLIALTGFPSIPLILTALSKGLEVYSYSREFLALAGSEAKKLQGKYYPLDEDLKALLPLAGSDNLQAGSLSLIDNSDPFKAVAIKDLFGTAYGPYIEKSTTIKDFVDEATGLKALFGLVTVSSLSNKPFDYFSAKSSADPKDLAALKTDKGFEIAQKAGEPGLLDAWTAKDLALTDKGNDYLTDYDKDRHPLFGYLAFMYKTQGERALIAANAADEIALQQFKDGKIRFGDVETIIRRTVSNIGRDDPQPQNIEDIKKVDSDAAKMATTIATSIANALKNGVPVVLKAHKKPQPFAFKDNPKEEAESKRDSRWKNDPSKKHLWQEHLKTKAQKEKQEEAGDGEDHRHFDRGDSHKRYGHSSFGHSSYGHPNNYGHSSYGHRSDDDHSHYGHSSSSRYHSDRDNDQDGDNAHGYHKDSYHKDSYHKDFHRDWHSNNHEHNDDPRYMPSTHFGHGPNGHSYTSHHSFHHDSEGGESSARHYDDHKTYHKDYHSYGAAKNWHNDSHGDDHGYHSHGFHSDHGSFHGSDHGSYHNSHTSYGNGSFHKGFNRTNHNEGGKKFSVPHDGKDDNSDKK